MTETGSYRHPAVLAGLMGSAIWAGAPTVALASPVDDVVSAVSGSLLLQFVAGCAIGAAVAGVISFVADRLAAGYEDEGEGENEGAADEQELQWTSSSLNLITAQEEAGEEDPTGDLGRFRTGQITIDFPVLGEQAVAQAIAGPRHFAPAGERRPEKRTTRRTGRHFAGAAKKAADVPAELASEAVASVVEAVAAIAPVAAVAPVVAATPRRGRHFATSPASDKVETMQAVASPKEERPVEKNAELTPDPTPIVVSTKAPAPVPELHGRARLAALPVIESRHAPVRTPHKTIADVVPEVAVSEEKPAEATGAIRDVVNERPVERPVAQTRSKHAAREQSELGFTGRLRMSMAARAKGVRAVLAERLGRDALDGVPIIERANGTTIEVTPSWFDQTVAPALASITGVTSRIEDTATRMEQTTGVLRVQTDEPSRASYIAHRVAEVNVGIFPERRSGDELERGDVWEEALAAMGETIAQNNPQAFGAPAVFQDVVGGPSTIDDPDGLEGPTGFIPFRVPAAHPEVVDTETYVDYLLRDEISQNGSPVLNRSPHAHLRVIEGGTGKLRTRRRPEDSGPVKEGRPAREGRHFAQPAFVAEA